MKKVHELCGACNRGEPHGDRRDESVSDRAVRGIIALAYFERHGFWPEDS